MPSDNDPGRCCWRSQILSCALFVQPCLLYLHSNARGNIAPDFSSSLQQNTCLVIFSHALIIFVIMMHVSKNMKDLLAGQFDKYQVWAGDVVYNPTRQDSSPLMIYRAAVQQSRAKAAELVGRAAVMGKKRSCETILTFLLCINQILPMIANPLCTGLLFKNLNIVNRAGVYIFIYQATRVAGLFNPGLVKTYKFWNKFSPLLRK